MFVLVCHSFADSRDVHVKGFAQYFANISCFSKLGMYVLTGRCDYLFSVPQLFNPMNYLTGSPSLSK